MNVYPSRRRNKKPKAAPLPRDKLEKTKEAAYFEKNFLAANKKKSEIDRKVGYLRNKISALRHADHQRSVVRRIFGTLSKDPQEETDMLLAELRALQEKRFRFDGRELDIHSLVRHCDREAGRWAGRLIDIERELKARVALDAREARELVARERKTKKEAKQKEQAALAAARLEKQRELADTIKRKLSREHPCPYCNQPLGNNPHADHIYPVSRGGISVVWNMVFVCETCNKKRATCRSLSLPWLTHWTPR